MIILALDQASVTSGYSVFDNDQLIDSGTFTINQGHVGQRLVKIKNKVLELIVQYHVEHLIFEDIQMQQQNVVTYKALAEVLGILEMTTSEMKIPYNIIPPSTWRAGLNIKGRVRAEQKKNAQIYALTQYNKQVSEDESDAICIGAYYISQNSCAF